MEKQIRVIMVGPGRSVHGGISGVVNGYYEAGLHTKVHMKYIGTMREGGKAGKLLVAMIAYVRFLFSLPFYQIVHVHFSSDNSYRRKSPFIITAALFRKKVVLHQHGGDIIHFYHKELTDAGRRRFRKVVGRGDVMLVIAPYLAEFFASVVPEEKIIVFPDGTFVPEKITKRYGQNKILFLGRLCREKGIGELFDCIPRLMHLQPTPHIYLGGIWEDETLKKEAEKYGEYVTWEGWLQKEKKVEILTECDLFVLPSHFEGQSVAILEAMAYGCGIVASDVGGIPQMILDGETGVLVRPGDSGALAEGLIRLMQAPAQCEAMAAAAREKVKREFSIEKNLEELSEIYESLL